MAVNISRAPGDGVYAAGETGYTPRGDREVSMGTLPARILVGLLAFVGGCANNQAATIRILTYNIHHAEGTDGRIDIDRIAKVILHADADIVALQEVDRGVDRTDALDQPAVLARLTGMRAIFAKNIDFQGGEYGNAVLTRLPVEFHENHHPPNLGQNEQRGLLEVHVSVGGQRLVFFATHFDHRADDSERLASVALLRRIVRERGAVPVIVAGDLNAVPDSRVIGEASEFLVDSFRGVAATAYTYPAETPARRIDYILHTRHPALKPIECRVIAEATASDHRPVLAVFRAERSVN